MQEAVNYSFDDVIKAFKTLGLEAGDYANVDKAYKKLARQNHPDVGGDVDKMKVINNAKDAIEKGQKVQSGQEQEDSRAFWDRIDKEYKAGNSAILSQLTEKIVPELEKYTGYFESVTGDRYTFSHKSSSSRDGAVLAAEWISDDKSKYFTLSFQLHYRPSSNEIGSSKNKEFSAFYDSYMFIQSKKFKIKNRRWTIKNFDSSDFADPSEVFPKAKIKKATDTNQSKPIKRADFEKYLHVQFGAYSQGDRDWIYIPLGKDKVAKHALVMHRSTFLGQGTWGIWGLGGLAGSGEHQRYTTGGKVKVHITYKSMPETRTSMEALKEIVKLAKEGSESGDVSKLNDYLKQDHKDWYEEKTNESLVDLLKEYTYDKEVIQEKTTVKGVTMSTKNLSEQFLEITEANTVGFGGKTDDEADDVGAILDPMNPDKKNGKSEGKIDVPVETVTDILDTMNPDAKNKKDEAVILEEGEDSELPQKLSNILSRLSKKPTATKVEMQGALIDDLLKIIQELPTSAKLLRNFIKDANVIVMKGEELPAE